MNMRQDLRHLHRPSHIADCWGLSMTMIEGGARVMDGAHRRFVGVIAEVEKLAAASRFNFYGSGAAVEPLPFRTLSSSYAASVPYHSPLHALYLTFFQSRRFGRRTSPLSFTFPSYGPSGLIRHSTRRPLAGNFDPDDLDDLDALTDYLTLAPHSLLLNHSYRQTFRLPCRSFQFHLPLDLVDLWLQMDTSAVPPLPSRSSSEETA